MKKLLLLTVAVFALTSIVFASQGPVPVAASQNFGKEKISNEEVKSYLIRLSEIDKMSKSTLTRDQKRDLRKEVKAIKSRLDGGYVYISGTAILIIILLILLL